MNWLAKVEEVGERDWAGILETWETEWEIQNWAELGRTSGNVRFKSYYLLK